MPEPILSIVIVSYNAEKTIRKCLNSLIDQVNSEKTEIILVDCSTDNTAKIVKNEFPSIKLFHFPQRISCGEARNFGNSQARGKIIACIDADCIAEKDWVNNILEAHQSSYVVIGGPVKNGNPESFVGWAVYLCVLGPWLPKKESSEMKNICACNVSYKKWVFEKFGGFLEKNYSHDTAFNWKLYKNGYKLYFTPFISVYHINPTSLTEFIKYSIVRGRDFSIVKTVFDNFSRFRTAVYIILFPLLPIVSIYRYIVRVLDSIIPLKRLLIAFPFMVIGGLAWSVGEIWGYFSYLRNNKFI